MLGMKQKSAGRTKAQSAPAFIMDENIFSSDIGNGWCAGYRMVKGKIRVFGIPHARARATGATLNTDVGSQEIVEYADFLGRRYAYGDGIWNLVDAPVEVHQNTERRYGDNMHIFMLLVNIAALGVRSGSDLTVIAPVPPGMLNNVAPILKERLYAGEDGSGDGVWTIRLRRDRQPRVYRFTRVVVLPEGAGAFAAFRFDENGDVASCALPGRRDALAGRVAVVDLGAGTGDVYTLLDGNLTPDSIRHSTNDKAGIITHMLKPLLDEIRQAMVSAGYPDPTYLTTAHVDSFLRRYIAAFDKGDAARVEAATVQVLDAALNIEESILARCEEYAQWIGNSILDPLFTSGVGTVIAAGGAWNYIAPFISRWYANRTILMPGSFPHTSRIAYHDLNGIGQLRAIAFQLKQQQV